MNLEIFQKKFRMKLFESGLSQEAFGKLFNCHQTEISCWLTGRHIPEPKRMKQLLSFLEMDGAALKA